MFRTFPYYRQLDEMDCGPTCLRIICKYFGKEYSLEYLRSLAFTSREGSSLSNISYAAEKLGFKTLGAKVKYEDLLSSKHFPFICYWKQKHFVVVYRMSAKYVWVSDPAYGLIRYMKEDFLKNWNDYQLVGIVLMLEPTHLVKEHQEVNVKNRNGFSFILQNAKKYKLVIFQIILGLLTTSILQLVLPFLTQKIVDTGIRQSNYHFIYLILIAQLFIFFGRTLVEIIRSRLLLHLSGRLSIKLLADFLIKLMRLPINYYDSKKTGDIIQRINDHVRVETFITSGVMGIAYAIISLVIFFVVLAVYNFSILVIFLVGSILYFLWIQSFAKRRAVLDFIRFDILATTSDKNLEILSGMQEIKLSNAEKQKRTEWENIQIQQFQANSKSLSLKQLQIDGAAIINELKNVIITFVAATLVIQGALTLGMMLSISFIIGQLNGPVLLITQFLQDYQDAQLSLERINEIHNIDNEDVNVVSTKAMIPIDEPIRINNLSFSYSKSTMGPFVLKQISLIIPPRKITAIVGSSGSGKTTLMKLLLKFYNPSKGSIMLDSMNFSDIPQHNWRAKCGVVMQEGFIFNDTISNNIALGNTNIDEAALREACNIANISDFIMTLPLKFQTKVGITGLGLSTGQKQRILIARAVYKKPDLLFFDEATSALDANNERVIMENLLKFFKGRTVVIIAHRLSTVYQSDQIVVLENGEIVEQGTHKKLVDRKGNYYKLIKNQLELGN